MKLSKPRVSFVIPAYNADRWISKAIWSCRNQTIKQIEVVVVNDGSTDSTQEICEWHAKDDPRVKLFNQENRGRSCARNWGNDHADSDIILVLDADDMAARNRAKDTIAAFELQKCDMAFGNFYAMDSMGKQQNKMKCQPFDPVRNKEKGMNFICHSTMAYRKELAQKIRYEEGAWSKLGLDDWKFQWEVYRSGYKIGFIKSPLCYYRVTVDGTESTRNTEMVQKVKESYFATF